MQEPITMTEQGRCRPAEGLATASLVLGGIGLLTAVFVVGILFSIPGLVLGIVALQRAGSPRGRAAWGIGLSSAGIVLAVVLAALVATLFCRTVRPALRNLERTAEFDAKAWVGKAAPAIRVAGADGTPVQIPQTNGTPAVLVFWASWYAPSVTQLVEAAQLARDGSARGATVVAVCADGTATPVLPPEVGAPLPLVAAAVLPSPYADVSAVPTTMVVDGGGVVRRVLVGGYDAESLAEAVREAEALPAEGAP